MFLGAAEYPDDNEVTQICTVSHTCPHCGRVHETLSRRRDGAVLRSGHAAKKANSLSVMDAAEISGVTEDAFNSTTVVSGWCILSRQEFDVTAEQVMEMARGGHQWHIDQIIKEFEEIACR